MTIVEYILDPQDKPRSFHPKTIPSWITDGGYWLNYDGSEAMIGVGSEGSIPDGVKTFTLEELIARQLAIHAKYPFKMHWKGGDNPVPEVWTDDEVEVAIREWWAERDD